jgi:hypothetical protein
MIFILFFYMIFLILFKIILALIFMLIIGKLIRKFGDLFNLDKNKICSNDFFSMLLFSVFITFLLFYIIPYILWTLLAILLIIGLFFYLFKKDNYDWKKDKRFYSFVFWATDKYNYYLRSFFSYNQSNNNNKLENITYIAGEHFIGQNWYKTKIEKKFYLYGDAKIKFALFENIFNLAGSIDAEKCEFEDRVEIISFNISFKHCRFEEDLIIIIQNGFKEEDINIIFFDCIFKKNIFFKGISDFKLDKSNILKGEIEYI